MYTSIFITFLFLLLVFYLAFIFYTRLKFKNIVNNKPKVSNNATNISFSILLPVRNEAVNIVAIINNVLQQSYTNFELIVIDDFSDDETVALINNFSNQRLKLLQLSSTNIGIGKKNAIAYGVNNATNSFIVTLDADVTLHNTWLQTIANFIDKNPNCNAIAAPVLMHGQNTFLSNFQQIDFLTMQGITAVALNNNWFAMCNGANFIYRKSAYYAVQGFANINHVASGDDMLLLQKIMKLDATQVFYLLHNQAIALTPTEPTIKKFIQQRIRWASKATVYNNLKIKSVLLLIFLLNVCFVFGLFCLPFAFKNLGLPLFLALVLKTIIEYNFVAAVAKTFNKKYSFIKFFLMQAAHIFYIVSSALFSFVPNYSWKGRKTK
jgi:poly-beta-1,6-N-acetyl-D-glucosamine synthase